MTTTKNAAAAELGRLGGAARAAKLDKDHLSRIARMGAAARWKGHTPKGKRRRKLT